MTRKLKLASRGGVSSGLASAALATLSVIGSMAATVAHAQEGGNAVRGQHVFRKCTTCHVINPSSTALLAPPLQGVIGRAAATIPGFEYSDIMKIAGQRGLVWTKDALYHFLDRPDQFIPGTYMTFAGLEPVERADVIAYLETLTPGAPKEKSEPGTQPPATKDKESNAARDGDRARAAPAPSASGNRPRPRSEARSGSGSEQ